MCQQRHKSQAASPLYPWELPQEPWSRLHIDYAGPIRDKMLFIIVDICNQLEYGIGNDTKLLIAFATHGLPRTIVSDNGPCFTSSEFEQFVKCNGIRHLKTAPYHPASNGLAERVVQTVKNDIRHMVGGDLESKVVLLICPFFKQIREQYLKSYYYIRPSHLKLEQLLCSSNNLVLLKLAKFSTIILKQF